MNTGSVSIPQFPRINNCIYW